MVATDSLMRQFMAPLLTIGVLLVSGTLFSFQPAFRIPDIFPPALSGASLGPPSAIDADTDCFAWTPAGSPTHFSYPLASFEIVIPNVPTFFAFLLLFTLMSLRSPPVLFSSSR